MSEAVLTTAELAERWKTSAESVLTSWRAGSIPAPLNAHQARAFRWALAAVEAFERGDWQAKAAVAS